jgi:hypothetical protein
MSKKRQSHDQKRKAKLAQRTKKHPAPSEFLAYKGNKFRTPELAPLYMATETGIVESDAITGHTLTDRHVRTALETLIEEIREGKLEPLDPEAELSFRHGEETALITTMIRLSWADRFHADPPVGDETTIGVLRSLLGSIQTWTTPSPTSRGYINYVTGFLRKLGVRVVAQTEGGPVEQPEDPFREVGEAWVLDHDQVARGEFLRQAAEMVRRGEGERVAEVAQMLMAQAKPGLVTEELMRVSVAAQRGEVRALPG